MILNMLRHGLYPVIASNKKNRAITPIPSDSRNKPSRAKCTICLTFLVMLIVETEQQKGLPK